MATTARIGPELITFLEQLKKNNNREWFQKDRSVKARRMAGDGVERCVACVWSPSRISTTCRGRLQGAAVVDTQASSVVRKFDP